MTDNQLIPAGRAGASLATFIPTNMDEVKRMAQWAAVGGMAPISLTKGKTPEQATAACAIAIMAGAELGLTPMMALRSYAVVNGRPTLWGDGLIAVVMKAAVYKPGSLKKGYDAEKKVGWCEAERTDGAKWREEFTEAQAKKAGLLGKDGPWQSYPDVMMTRRAINKCLNFLFADVLGGFVTEDEAYDMIDVTPAPRQSPVQDAPEIPETVETSPSSMGEKITTADQADDFNNDDSSVSTEPFNVDAFISRLDEELSSGTDDESVTEIWDGLGVEANLSGDEDALARAFAKRTSHINRVSKAPQGDLLGDAPEIE